MTSGASHEMTAYRSNARSERFIIKCQHVCSFEGTEESQWQSREFSVVLLVFLFLVNNLKEK